MVLFYLTTILTGPLVWVCLVITYRLDAFLKLPEKDRNYKEGMVGILIGKLFRWWWRR